MAKQNPRVEFLEKENNFLRDVIDKLREPPPDIPFAACDASCICVKATGQHTNGGCRCDERKLRQAVTWWRRRAEFLQTTIIEMRDGDSVKAHDDLIDFITKDREERFARSFTTQPTRLCHEEREGRVPTKESWPPLEPGAPTAINGYERYEDPHTGDYLYRPKKDETPV